MSKVNIIVSRITDVANKSTMTSKHGAAIFGKGVNIISTGYNHCRGCIDSKPILSCHAEMDALLRLLNNYHLYALKGLMNDEKNTTLARNNKKCLSREKGIY